MVDDKKVVLALPIPHDAPFDVAVRFRGRDIQATYTQKGLNEYWHFEDGKAYIQLLSNGYTALYWDFTGANPGEPQRAKDQFRCSKDS